MVFWFPEPRTGIGLFLFYLHELTALSQTYVGKLILCVSIYIYMSYMRVSHMKYILYIFAFIVYTLRYPQISWGPGVMSVARWSRAWTWGEGENQGQLVLWSVYIPASSSTGAVWILTDGVIFRDPKHDPFSTPKGRSRYTYLVYQYLIIPKQLH